MRIAIQLAQTNGVKAKSFCERTLALHRQQPEKISKISAFPPLEKLLRTPTISL